MIFFHKSFLTFSLCYLTSVKYCYDRYNYFYYEMLCFDSHAVGIKIAYIDKII